jgi:hypothetical protein
MLLALSPKSDPAIAAPPRRTAPSARLALVSPSHPERAGVERFVQRVYAERYGADVRQFAPMLVALHDDGEIVAAAGYRPAGAAPLFLERYLSAPVETLLETRLGAGRPAAPSRQRIVEVGHLAGQRAGAGRRLIGLLGPHLAAQGFQWVVSTLTEELRHLFVRLGVAPLALGVADPAALGDAAPAWGTYYDHRPEVLAGHIELALLTLARRQAVS